MSTQINPEKPLVNAPRFSSIQSISSITQGKTSNEKPSFASKIKEIKAIIAQKISVDKQSGLFMLLQELNDIYQIDTQQEKVKYLKGKFSEFEVRNQGDSGKDKARTSEKVILEVREGAKIINEIKIDTQTRIKSPQKKVEQKKFMKFDPKKTAKTQALPSLANILKPGSNN